MQISFKNNFYQKKPIKNKHKRYHYYKNMDISIDSFTMDTIEKRYQHYRDEGGNSYITNIMKELRDMAKEDKQCSNIG